MQDGDRFFRWHVSASLEAAGAPWIAMLCGMDEWADGVFERLEPLILAERGSEVLTLRQTAEFIADHARAQASR